MSAGNAGRSFATMCAALDVRGVVVMPDSAPEASAQAIERLGASVVRTPGPELLATASELARSENLTLVHPFDDVDLIAGHASCGIEILEDLPSLGEDDCVVVCCGGGGLVSGVAAVSYNCLHKLFLVYGM